METQTPKYNIKTVDFIITADTIINSAIANQPFLVTKRANWSPEFFQEIKTQIETATQNYLGYDNAKQLREATQKVYAIMQDAVKRQMLADENVGIFLSGGTDSAILAKLANHSEQKKLHTLSIYFAEKNLKGESQFYSLGDFNGVRNDASFEKDYIKGKYGAIPFVGDFTKLFEEK